MSPEALEDRRTFWSSNQPGMRFTELEPGTPAFFEAVERQRYKIEPPTFEMAHFTA